MDDLPHPHSSFLVVSNVFVCQPVFTCSIRTSYSGEQDRAPASDRQIIPPKNECSTGYHCADRHTELGFKELAPAKIKGLWEPEVEGPEPAIVRGARRKGGSPIRQQTSTRQGCKLGWPTLHTPCMGNFQGTHTSFCGCFFSPEGRNNF